MYIYGHGKTINDIGRSWLYTMGQFLLTRVEQAFAGTVLRQAEYHQRAPGPYGPFQVLVPF